MPTHSVTIIEDSLYEKVAALEERVAKLEAAAREPAQPVLPEGADRESQVTLAAATQSKPPRPPTCGEDISDCDLSPMRLCDNDPHYYAPCCGWSCGEHKCRHARCVDDDTAPEGEDDD